MDIRPEQIIWSADVTPEELRDVVRSEALPVGTVIKLDRLYFEKYGKDSITYCQERGYPVFADAKIAEIPDKVIGITKTYLHYKPWMLNVMAGICSTMKLEDENPKKIDALKRFADACAEVGTKSCAVTVLTSKTAETCQFEFGSEPIDQVMWYVDQMCACGLTDIVCSPQEASKIRSITTYDKLLINTPGVRLPTSDANDQARIATPLSALKNGSDRLVIGRDLTGSREDGPIVERIKRNYAKIMANLKE